MSTEDNTLLESGTRNIWEKLHAGVTLYMTSGLSELTFCECFLYKSELKIKNLTAKILF